MSQPNKIPKISLDDVDTTVAAVPMRLVGPMLLKGDITGEFVVPLATYETPLWPSVGRGAKVSLKAGGIAVTIVGDRMSRSIVLEAPDAATARRVVSQLLEQRDQIADCVAETSSYALLEELDAQIVANIVYIRFAMSTGDAAGHNMVTVAADHVGAWILRRFPELRYVSVSGNYCADKKVSAVNGILGRGKYIIAEMLISSEICRRFLRTTPEKVVDLNLKKNWIGSTIAGSLRSANAHFANMLLAFYLATGQDAANIIEGSQGFTHAELRDDQLYFSVTLPNIVVGSVGNGKDLDFVVDNLRKLGCLDKREIGDNGRRLGAIAAATVLCGELSLLAAQTNPGELVRSHLRLERK